MAGIIRIHQVSKAFNSHTILNQVDLTVHDGEFLTLLGPSGCGKTTLLKMLSGFESPDSGEISFQGQCVNNLPPRARDVHTVFQHYALFPHMSVYDNIAFGPRAKGLDSAIIHDKVQRILARVQLCGLAERFPHELSGGQAQRVAIARAAINEPLVLLLDEPLSSLDYKLRQSMQMELRQLQRQLGITFIFVTHDQEEALSLSDRIAVILEGKIAQIGTPREVYEEPNSLAVAKFIGGLNVFDTQITCCDASQMQVLIEEKTLTLPRAKGLNSSDKVHILVRPEDLRVYCESDVTDTQAMLPGIIEESIYKGSTVDLIVQLESGMRLSATEFFDEDDTELTYKRREKVWVHWLPGWEVVLAHETSTAL